MKLKVKDMYLDAEITNPFKSNQTVVLRFLDKKYYEKYYKIIPQFFEIITTKKKDDNENTGS